MTDFIFFVMSTLQFFIVNLVMILVYLHDTNLVANVNPILKSILIFLFLQGNMKQHALTHKNSSLPLSPSNSNSNSQFNNSCSDSEDKDRDEERSEFKREEQNSRPELGLKRSPPPDESDESPHSKRIHGKTPIILETKKYASHRALTKI